MQGGRGGGQKLLHRSIKVDSRRFLLRGHAASG
jgi:hypothetical protein